MGSERDSTTKEFDVCECGSDAGGEGSEVSLENEFHNFTSVQVRLVNAFRVLYRSAKICMFLLYFCLP
jgi:hypothetical protein